MVISTFFVLDKDIKIRFFEKSFLLANVSPDVGFKMLFLTISNANVNFQAQHLQLRSYIAKEVLPTIRQVKLIVKKEFALVALDLNHKTFLVYVAALNNSGAKVNPSIKAQIAYLKADDVPTNILSKYTTFSLQSWL